MLSSKLSFTEINALLWNILDDYIISAPNCKIFNDRLLDTYLVPFFRDRALM